MFTRQGSVNMMALEPSDIDPISQALQLRSQGLGFREIARIQGVAVATAHARVQSGIRAALSEPAGELVMLERERLDLLQDRCSQLLERVPPLVQHGRVIVDSSGNALPDCEHTLRVIDRILRIMERRARLLGLDAPTKARVEVVTEEAVDAEIARLESKIAIREIESQRDQDDPDSQTGASSDD